VQKKYWNLVVIMMEMCNEYIAIQKKKNLNPTLIEFLKRCGDIAPDQKKILEFAFAEERQRLTFNSHEGRGNWNRTPPLDIKPIHGPSDAMGSAIIEAQKKRTQEIERNIYSNMIAFSGDPSRNIRGRSSEFMWFDDI
jgi:hypothetical protein